MPPAPGAPPLTAGPGGWRAVPSGGRVEAHGRGLAPRRGPLRRARRVEALPLQPGSIGKHQSFNVYPNILRSCFHRRADELKSQRLQAAVQQSSNQDKGAPSTRS